MIIISMIFFMKNIICDDFSYFYELFFWSLLIWKTSLIV